LNTTWRFIPFQLCNSNFNLKRTSIRHKGSIDIHSLLKERCRS
jgi:hypothetical protein